MRRPCFPAQIRGGSRKNSYRTDPFGNKTGRDPVFMIDHVPSISTERERFPSAGQNAACIDRKVKQQYNI